MEGEPPIIPRENELPMDAYNVAMHVDLMMQHMNIQRPSEFLDSYPYIPTWDELWAEQQGGARGSSGGDDEE